LDVERITRVWQRAASSRDWNRLQSCFASAISSMQVGHAFAYQRAQVDVQPATGATMIPVLLVILVLMLIAAVPAWPHSRSWGYAPSGTLGLVVLVLLLLALSGRI
jgi:hypothetical protein